MKNIFVTFHEGQGNHILKSSAMLLGLELGLFHSFLRQNFLIYFERKRYMFVMQALRFTLLFCTDTAQDLTHSVFQDIIYMYNLKNDTNEHIYKTKQLTNTLDDNKNMTLAIFQLGLFTKFSIFYMLFLLYHI